MKLQLRIARPQQQLVLAALPGLLMMLALGDAHLLLRLAIAASVCVLCAGLHAVWAQRPLTLSWLITALILAVALPAATPLLLLAMASLVSMAVGRILLRGTPINAAMLGYATLALLLPAAITLPPDATSGATLLTLADHGLREHWTRSEILAHAPSAWQRILLALAWIGGGAWLIRQRVIHWHIPAGVIAGLSAAALLPWLLDADRHLSPLQHLLGGGALFAAFFVATDPRAAPRQRWAYGLSIGVLTLLMRQFSPYVDGLAFAVLASNLLWHRSTSLRPLLIAAVGAALLVAISAPLRQHIDAQQQRHALNAQVNSLFAPLAVSVQWQDGTPPHARIVDADHRLHGWITQASAPGYGGMLTVQVISNARGTRLHRRILDHHETPAYLPANLDPLDGHLDGLGSASFTAHALRAALADAQAQAQSQAERLAHTVPTP